MTLWLSFQTASGPVPLSRECHVTLLSNLTGRLTAFSILSDLPTFSFLYCVCVSGYARVVTIFGRKRHSPALSLVSSFQVSRRWWPFLQEIDSFFRWSKVGGVSPFFFFSSSLNLWVGKSCLGWKIYGFKSENLIGIKVFKKALILMGTTLYGHEENGKFDFLLLYLGMKVGLSYAYHLFDEMLQYLSLL